MQKLQEQLKMQEHKFSSAGGAIELVLNGHGDFLSLRLDPEFLKEDAQVVSDAILNAVQEASKKAKNSAQESMKGLTGGLNIPGLSGLF